MFPLTLENVARTVSGTLYLPDTDSSLGSRRIDSVTIDSRKMQAGDLFFALQGNRQDGHEFLSEVTRKQGAAAVVERLPEKLTLPCIQVSDVIQALQQLAAWNRRQSDALVVALTGSVGKTSTRHLLHGVLSTQFHGCQSPHNYNNHLGVPLSLLQIHPEHEFALIEIGTSAPGEIDFLARLVSPEMALITEIGPAHLEGLQSIIRVAEEKAALLKHIPESGYVFLPHRLLHLVEHQLRKTHLLRTVGFEQDSDYQAEEIEANDGNLCFSLKHRRYVFPQPGQHWLTPALLSHAVAGEIGLPPETIQQGFDQFQPPPGRCMKLRTSLGYILDDSYNANPISMRAGLQALRALCGVTQKIAVLGEMRELGNFSAPYHRRLGKQVARSDTDFLLTLGTGGKIIAQGAIHAGFPGSRIACFASIEALLPILKLWRQENSAVLVKGAHSLQMNRIVLALQEDDAAIHLGENTIPRYSATRAAA